jgi:hypothetical protein
MLNDPGGRVLLLFVYGAVLYWLNGRRDWSGSFEA